MRAMVLAAGRGERLRPLTDTIPKPLLPVGSGCLIEQNLIRLAAAGVTDVVINVSYLAKQIIQYLGNGARYGLNVEYSYDGEECLGTGGGVYKALSMLGDKPFWVVSADVWSEFSFVDNSLCDEDLAHLVMVPNPEFHTKGDYGLDDQGKLTMQLPKLTYAGIGLIRPELFADCEPGIFSFSPLINRAMQLSAVSGELYEGSWFNVGTAREFQRLCMQMQQRSSVSLQSPRAG